MDPLYVLSDTQALDITAAAWLAEWAESCVAQRGVFHLVLAGGSTPRGLYQRLAAPPHSKRMPWRKTHVWFGDERAVPPDHPDSNYRMARESLLDHVPIRPEQVHRIGAEEAPEAAAEAYVQSLARSAPQLDGLPCLDLVLLGLGEDGHVASLFPGTNILEERERWAAPVRVEHLDTWRVSLTLPVINNARAVWLLVTGESKAATVARALAPMGAGEGLPVRRLAPRSAPVWLIDHHAARDLKT
jgi:6-phosphogluconolactonase